MQYKMHFRNLIRNEKSFNDFSFENISSKIQHSNNSVESGSTARNASAQISTAPHFFQKCHLLDTKSVNCSTDKSVPHFVFEQLIKKVQSTRIFEQMTKFL